VNNTFWNGTHWVAAFLVVMAIGVGARKCLAHGDEDSLSQHREYRDTSLSEEEIRQVEQAIQDEHATPAPAPRYEVAPMLKRAWASYTDWNGRDRDETVRLFRQYIEEDPESSFLPEVYFRLGTLYSTNRNQELGETRDRQLAADYFRKAHEAYGRKFSYEHNAAWGSLVNYSRDVEKMREYYDWLLSLEVEGTVEDIHRVQGIGHAVNGHFPEMPPDVLAKELAALKEENLPKIINTTERNIFAVATIEELRGLAAAYPTTELGHQAALRVQQYDEAMLRAVNRELSGKPELMPVATGPLSEELDGYKSSPETSLSRADGSTSSLHLVSSVDRNRWSSGWVVLVCIVMIVIAGGLVILWRRAKRTEVPADDT